MAVSGSLNFSSTPFPSGAYIYFQVAYIQVNASRQAIGSFHYYPSSSTWAYRGYVAAKTGTTLPQAGFPGVSFSTPVEIASYNVPVRSGDWIAWVRAAGTLNFSQYAYTPWVAPLSYLFSGQYGLSPLHSNVCPVSS